MSESGLLRLRMPPDLKTRVAAAAKSNNRSMNAEIVQRLEDTFGGMQAYMRLEYSAERLDRLMDFLEESGLLERAVADHADDALADHQRDRADEDRG